MGLTKAPKSVAEGDLPERTAIRFYVFVGVIMIIIAFLGIRHFASVPNTLPDIFGSLPK